MRNEILNECFERKGKRGDARGRSARVWRDDRGSRRRLRWIRSGGKRWDRWDYGLGGGVWRGGRTVWENGSVGKRSRRWELHSWAGTTKLLGGETYFFMAAAEAVDGS